MTWHDEKICHHRCHGVMREVSQGSLVEVVVVRAEPASEVETGDRYQIRNR